MIHLAEDYHQVALVSVKGFSPTAHITFHSMNPMCLLQQVDGICMAIRLHVGFDSVTFEEALVSHIDLPEASVLVEINPYFLLILEVSFINNES